MNENNNNNNNKQGYKKKFYPKKKWNNRNNNNKNQVNETEIKNEENIQETEIIETEVIVEDIIEETEIADNEVEIKKEVLEEKAPSAGKKIVKEVEDEKEDFNKPEDIDQEFLKIDWPLYDKLKLSTDFHRGCRLKADEYAVGRSVLRHSQCKLDSFNWLKDYHETAYEGELLIAEVRFKNDRKDFYSYPSELELIEGELHLLARAQNNVLQKTPYDHLHHDKGF